MDNYEIERKFLIKELPENLESYQSLEIEQGYLCTKPTIRVRKSNDEYYMTYKGNGLLSREEYNLPLTKEAYESLVKKSEGNIISKTRYVIPIEGSHLKIELDVFKAPFDGLILAEVEFDSTREADSFVMPDWFLKDVTGEREYYNSNMSQKKF